MRKQPHLFRLSAALAIGATAFGALLQAAPAQAQTAQTPTSPSGDPPGRVGRLARLTGTVSFHTTDQTAWQPATLNYPVTSGNSFWTEPSSGTQIEVAATHLALDQQTQLDIDMLTDTAFVATEGQGALYLRIGAVNPGETYTLNTPRGTVNIAAVGRYEVVAGDSEQPTTVTVVEGAAQVTVNNQPLSVGPHQTATITGTDQFQGSVGPETDDPFLTAQLQAERPPLATASAGSSAAVYQPPAVVQEMTGAQDLVATGSWAEAPQYGHVWYPPVDPGWVPYRHGHWAYVAPWGWTWVDEASWGFAPYHYGRWVDVDNRWGWVPVAPDAPPAAPPVYSPALVDFVGIAAGVAVGAAIGVGVGLALGGGRGGGNIGWVPLGFGQPYLPPYQVSPGYINRINSPSFASNQNIGQIINQRRTQINNGTINSGTITNTRIANSNNRTVINNITNVYPNAAAATVVPVSAMQSSRPVAATAAKVTPEQFAQIARPTAAAAAVVPHPTAQTLGVTPSVAKRYNIPASQLVHPTVAPGPAVQPRAVGAVQAGHVPLQPAAARAAVAPAAKAVAPVAPGSAPAAKAVAPVAPGSAPAAKAVAPVAPGSAPVPAHAALPSLVPHGAAVTAPGRPGAAPGPAIVPRAAPSAAARPPEAAHPAAPSAKDATPAAPAAREAVPAARPAAPAVREPVPQPTAAPAVREPAPQHPAAPAVAAPAVREPAPAHSAAPVVAAPVVREPAPAVHPSPPAAPVAHTAPPAVREPAPAPAPRPAAPVVHEAPPAPVVREAPRPPPVERPAPPPAPAPRPEPPRPAPPPAPRPAPPPPPAAHKECPPGHATC